MKEAGYSYLFEIDFENLMKKDKEIIERKGERI
jgi:hypothetical protein